MNRRSFGHTFVTIKMHSLNRESPVVIQLIDLAASDSQGDQTTNESDNRRGISFVRKSLASLGAVLNGIVKLQSNPSTPISFRESSLTRLLKRVLTSKSHAVVIVNVCPSSLSYANSLQTLTFASRLLRYRHHAGTSPFQRRRSSLNTEAGLKINSPDVFLTNVEKANRDEAKQSLLKTIVADPRQRLSKILAKKVHKSSLRPLSLNSNSNLDHLRGKRSFGIGKVSDSDKGSVDKSMKKSSQLVDSEMMIGTVSYCFLDFTDKINNFNKKSLF